MLAIYWAAIAAGLVIAHLILSARWNKYQD